MSASLYTQGGIANPSVQDAYGLISQLNEKKLALVVEYVKQLLKQKMMILSILLTKMMT
ncbi:MAG: hypothetical protein K6G84_12525 [Lachnospiraceae bacterium]|nr:hypothetical protein [Lachnospiraceae bacterium]